VEGHGVLILMDFGTPLLQSPAPSMSETNTGDQGGIFIFPQRDSAKPLSKHAHALEVRLRKGGRISEWMAGAKPPKAGERGAKSTIISKTSFERNFSPQRSTSAVPNKLSANKLSAHELPANRLLAAR